MKGRRITRRWVLAIALVAVAVVGALVFAHWRGRVSPTHTLVAYERWIPDGPDNYYPSVRVRNLDTGGTRDVASTAEESAMEPAVSGSRVIFAYPREQGRQLMWEDLATGDRGQVLAQDGDQGEACAAGDWVAWVLTPAARDASRAIAYNMKTGVTRTVRGPTALLLTSRWLFVEIFSKVGQGGVVAVDLRTGARRWVARGYDDQLVAATGDLVVWRHPLPPPAPDWSSEVGALDLVTGVRRALPTTTGAVGGQLVAVVRTRSDRPEDTYDARIQVLPLAGGKPVATFSAAGSTDPSTIRMHDDWVVWISQSRASATSDGGGRVIAYNLRSRKTVVVADDASSSSIAASGE